MRGLVPEIVSRTHQRLESRWRKLGRHDLHALHRGQQLGCAPEFVRGEAAGGHRGHPVAATLLVVARRDRQRAGQRGLMLPAREVDLHGSGFGRQVAGLEAPRLGEPCVGGIALADLVQALGERRGQFVIAGIYPPGLEVTDEVAGQVAALQGHVGQRSLHGHVARVERCRTQGRALRLVSSAAAVTARPPGGSDRWD